MLARLFIPKVLFRFSIESSSRQIIQNNNKNLINPTINDPIAIGYHFPKQWSIQKIFGLIDPSRKSIQSIKIIQNKLGLSSGKILFTFKNLKSMQEYINRYNEDYIQTQDSVHRVILKKFELKTQSQKRDKLQYNTKFGVKLTNLDFDIDIKQLERLAQDFGEIELIDLPMKSNDQLNKGAAKIYFKSKQSSLQFVAFINDRIYKQRRLKCAVIKRPEELQKQKVFQQKQLPKLFMKYNEQLYKRMVRKEIDEKQTDKVY